MLGQLHHCEIGVKLLFLRKNNHIQPPAISEKIS